jgi:ABC-2 type transport system permease protein
MTAVVQDTFAMLVRHQRNFLRQPIWIAFALTQPMFWLLLYSQLFRRIVDLPGFNTTSYVQFLTPGIVVMTSFFGATWSGMSMIDDLDRGVVQRFLATPTRRVSLIASQVLHTAIVSIVQTVIILGTAWLLGARVERGVAGWILIIAVAALVAAAFSGISHGIALLVRREEPLIAILNFFGLPLTFISAILIAETLMPGWMRWVAKFNPVNWAVIASRELSTRGTDWSRVGIYLGLLAGFVVLTSALATRAFEAYRRTL